MNWIENEDHLVSECGCFRIEPTNQAYWSNQWIVIDNLEFRDPIAGFMTVEEAKEFAATLYKDNTQ